MKIEILEESLKVNVHGDLLALVKGDRVTVEDRIGELAVAHGWAKDLDGKQKTGERVPGAAAPIVPDAITQESK